MEIGYKVVFKMKDGKSYCNFWICIGDVIVDVKDFANKHENFTKQDFFNEIKESLNTQELPIEDERYIKRLSEDSLKLLCKNNELAVSEEGIFSKKEKVFDLDIFNADLEKLQKLDELKSERITAEDNEKLAETLEKLFPKGSNIKIS